MEKYLVEVLWSFPFYMCNNLQRIYIYGENIEDAINKFYQRGGGEIMQILDEEYLKL